ncbi:hypothetical protein HKBW3S43_01018 [Candidatus Hakubella thermalkaliphila]|uniref:Alpha-galactosidase n=1 Tax=Candidatus Hakubella thermalkaliphila TaxID=2754717 RepID=A0A6V8P8P9_9ACTN|nr:hypothetical protein [Candidatus Hakubella thermalkaliphila]GFP28703.1 hypothetical protein HKBW3S33_02117 [Candidatus Hakubella thermalkaliphila]GFP35226.1 hypothetical protein HKBW3S43_01018 [Candidatus Hakubella thermalkaliphila]GFP41495.1 hypothetical protein HKBW3C_00620 [Candidatus Hakubella thermalkaliphila]
MKITFIGGGSLIFTQRLLAGLVFLPFPREEIEVTLVDINEKSLNYIERIARRIFSEKGVNEKNAGSITKCNT